MNGAVGKALAALLTDPATGALYSEQQVRAAGAWTVLAIAGVIVLIALALGLGEGR